MLHELLTIKNNYIYFEKSANLKENENEFVISCIHDDFYKKKYVCKFWGIRNEYKRGNTEAFNAKTTKCANSINRLSINILNMRKDDMQKALDNFPELKK